ncbi:NADH-quinone oxidoreductase subunit C [Altericroceibacterium xinjiangense]|uniref:NADH-quinone oxidoreductase subunit C n=1 Tax=Altericroceibacterium xinjiangense TaxID=762261 RepID=UPI000F7F6B14|nr:NADH-quinone oxidoreductase subunit C [Altericroceibacterium xinjiangense]
MTTPVLHSAPRYASHEGMREGISAALGAMLLDSREQNGELLFTVRREAIEDALRLLRDQFQYQQLMDIAGVDYPSRLERFEVVYMLLSVTRNHRIIVKVSTDETSPVPTVTTLWPNAGWLERETYDMYGVLFDGNLDLRRILTDYGFEGHPFRKDFPLTGYQELRYSEEQKRVVYEPVELPQDLRNFDFLSPWEGADYPLAGDEKASPVPPAPHAQPVPEKGGVVDTKNPVTRGAPTVDVPQTTDSPKETGAGAKTDDKAADHVAPGRVSKGTVSGQGDANPDPVETDIDAPGAPEATESRPGRDADDDVDRDNKPESGTGKPGRSGEGEGA